MNRKFADKLNLIHSMHQLLPWKTLILILKLQKRNVFGVFDTISKPKKNHYSPTFQPTHLLAANSPACLLFCPIEVLRVLNVAKLLTALISSIYARRQSKRVHTMYFSITSFAGKYFYHLDSWDCLSLELNFILYQTLKRFACPNLPKMPFFGLKIAHLFARLWQHYIWIAWFGTKLLLKRVLPSFVDDSPH